MHAQGLTGAGGVFRPTVLYLPTHMHTMHNDAQRVCIQDNSTVHVHVPAYTHVHAQLNLWHAAQCNLTSLEEARMNEPTADRIAVSWSCGQKNGLKSLAVESLYS